MSEYLNLFVQAPGNALYFIALIFFSYAALLIAIEQSLRGPHERAARRYRLALLGIMAALLSMFAVGGFALISGLNNELYLPPLELAVYTLLILLSGWAFLSAELPQPGRIWDIGLGVLLLVVAGGYAYTAVEWAALGQQVDVPFNATQFALAWTFVPALLCVFMTLLLIFRFRFTPDAPLKLVYFLVILTGYAYTLYEIVNQTLFGHYMGSLRSAFLLATPLLPVLAYRLVIARLTREAPVEAAPAPTRKGSPPRKIATVPSSPAERESTLLLRAFGEMMAGNEPDEMPLQIARATADTLKADLVALSLVKSENWLDVLAVYDNIQQKRLQGMAINLEEQPTLRNVIERKRQRALQPDENLEEIIDLYTRLDVIQTNPLGACHLQPLQRDGQVFAVLIVAFPYTTRQLEGSEIHLLEGIAPIASKLLTLSQTAAATGATPDLLRPLTEDLNFDAAIQARQQMQDSLEMARDQTNTLADLVRNLKIELEAERGRVAEILAGDEDTLSISQQMLALSEEGNQLQEQRDLLANELQEAQTTLAGATATNDDELYAAMIDLLSREQNTLEMQRIRLEEQLGTLREQTKDMFLIPASIQETLTAMAAEKNDLAKERDAVAAELSDVKSELELLGIDGGVAGLALILGQLYEERDALRAQVNKLSSMRPVEDDPDRQQKIENLEAELARVAADREAAVKQRDSLRAEKSDWQSERDKWQKQRQHLGQQISGIQAEIRDLSGQRDRASKERNNLAERFSKVQEERDRLLASQTAIQTERDQLIARLEGDREMLEQLGADGFGTLKAMIDDLTSERSQLEQQLLQAQADLDLMEVKLQDYEHAERQRRAVAPPLGLPEDPAVILSVAQELRTPMSSIIGYTDLLLGESVGILGALQRKFLQRVKANIERLSSLIEDLVSIIALDTGQINLTPEPVNVLELLDEAIMNAGTQFREKGITLNLDMDNHLRPIQVDRDAMQQVITQLLSNAYLVSPSDGEVTITAHEEVVAYPEEDGSREADSLFFTVQDQGGGIPPEDQARVFSRLYRADNPLIQGVGDTGVGLSIARALVEAHQGRVWVESELGIGTRFLVAIPYATVTEMN